MKRIPLDTYDILPPDMVNYLRHNGWHFNEKMLHFALKHMKRINISTGKLEPLKAWSKAEIDTMLSNHSITLEENEGQDYIYVANMAKADFYESSLTTEQQVAQFIKDMIDDADQGDGFIFNRFYADCCHKGIPIPWSEML